MSGLTGLRLLNDPIPIMYLQVAAKFSARKLLQILLHIWACIKISNWPNIYYLHVAAKFSARKLLQILLHIWACIKISNWPNIYYLHVAAKFSARKLLQILLQTRCRGP